MNIASCLDWFAPNTIAMRFHWLCEGTKEGSVLGSGVRLVTDVYWNRIRAIDLN